MRMSNSSSKIANSNYVYLHFWGDKQKINTNILFEYIHQLENGLSSRQQLPSITVHPLKCLHFLFAVVVVGIFFYTDSADLLYRRVPLQNRNTQKYRYTWLYQIHPIYILFEPPHLDSHLIDEDILENVIHIV